MAKRKYTHDDDEYNSIIQQPQPKISNGGCFDLTKFIPKDLKIVAKNESQKKLIQSIRNNQITVCGGHSGTGKSFIAISQALALLRKENSPYKKIYLVKSVTPLLGEEQGFLKGTLADKITPFMFSFYINFEKIIGEYALKILLEKEIIRLLPLTYMRGISLDDCIVCCDELQNVSITNSRTLMTRIGNNSKFILLGDTNQIDLKNKHDSSLIKLLNMFNETPDIGVVKMDENDENVRNPIITIIEEKYNEFNKAHSK